MSGDENINRTLEAEDAPAPDSDEKPDSPPDLDKKAWSYGVKRAVKEFVADGGTDLAAMLTYYTALSLAPAVLAIFSLASLVLASNADQVTSLTENLVSENVPADYRNLVTDLINTAAGSAGGGAIALIISIAVALWSSSAYVKAFGRCSNLIYERAEGRGFVKKTGTMLLTTLAMIVGVMLILVSLALNQSLVSSLLGPIAEPLGLTSVLNFLTETFLPIWTWVKWPVIIALIIVMIAVLYYFSPNIRMPKFRWVSLGSVIAIIGIGVAAVGLYFYFAYAAGYSSYGAIGSVMALLFALWVFNIMLIFGVEVEAEAERARELQSGIVAEESIQLPPRDTAKVHKQKEKRDETVEEGRELRQRHSDDNSDHRSDDSAHSDGAEDSRTSRGDS